MFLPLSQRLMWHSVLNVSGKDFYRKENEIAKVLFLLLIFCFQKQKMVVTCIYGRIAFWDLKKKKIDDF